MALSGWCGQRGKPNCKACPSDLCACRCHGVERAQNKGNGRDIETVEWDNESEPSRSVSALQPGSDPLPFATDERGCW